MKAIQQRESLKKLLLAELGRVVELLEEIPAKHMDCTMLDDFYSQKAELKSKMRELRRDTIRLDKMLLEYIPRTGLR